MNLPRAALLVLFAAAMSSTGHSARAEAPRSRYEQRSPAPVTRDVIDDLGIRYRLNEVTGQWERVAPAGSGKGGAKPQPQQTSAKKLPFQHFDSDDDGSEIVNSYLLAYLSMLVYSSEVYEEDFEEELLEILLPQGVIDVKAFVDTTGVEGALVSTAGATIVVFRGTSSEGTDLGLADYLADVNDAPQLVNVGGKSVYVHEGFWANANSVYPEILDEVQEACLNGRRIWLTGHSLGAALATLTAFRLHYGDDITVQGLQTFGSPKVGDANLAARFQDANSAGYALGDATIRWVIDGDPATTFFEKEIAGFNIWGPIWVYYEHVGVTHTIYKLDNGGFEVKYDTGEDKYMHWVFSGLFNEHSWYLEALTCEMTRIYLDANDGDSLEEILQIPSSD